MTTGVAPTRTRESCERLFLSQLALIDAVTAFIARRHHLSATDAEEFAAHVRLRILEDDYATLRKFEERSSLKTYLTTVIQRWFLDDRTARWGKWRPSAEAKRLGPLAILVERLMVRDGMTFDEACTVLETNHGVTVGRAAIAAIENVCPSASAAATSAKRRWPTFRRRAPTRIARSGKRNRPKPASGRAKRWRAPSPRSPRRTG